MRSKYEKLAHQELEEQGYIVDYKIRPPTFAPRGYDVDFFGAFDLVAFKPNQLPVRWISIKGHAGVLDTHREECRSVALPVGNQKEVWWMATDKKWRKEVL